MDKYKYATAWTVHDGYLGVRTYRAFCACSVLDYNKHVTQFLRNREILTYQLEGKTKQLTPDFKVCHKGSEFYLHCYKDSALTEIQKELLSQQYPIEFWEESKLINHPMVENINLMRRYHHGSLLPNIEESLVIPSLSNLPLSAQNLCDQLGYSLGEANKLLLKLSAYRKLRFDVNQPYTATTEFHLVES